MLALVYLTSASKKSKSFNAVTVIDFELFKKVIYKEG